MTGNPEVGRRHVLIAFPRHCYRMGMGRADERTAGHSADAYVAPEMVELGTVEELTLGCTPETASDTLAGGTIAPLPLLGCSPLG